MSSLIKSSCLLVCVVLCLSLPVESQPLNVFEQPGAVSWYELMTTDVDGAVDFYTQLFGWTTTEQILANGSRYIMLSVDGVYFGGMMTTPPQAEGAPPYWGMYVTVEDMESTVQQAQKSGATVIVPPTMSEGHWFSVLQDPQGAVFSVTAYDEIPEVSKTLELFAQHGAISWFELMTSDLDAAVAFYTELFGWTTDTMIMENGDPYITIKVADIPVGGMSKLPSQPENIPPNWGFYVTVDDVDASAQQAQELGGKLVLPPMDVPEVGRFCVIQDPQGAYISLMAYLAQQ